MTLSHVRRLLRHPAFRRLVPALLAGLLAAVPPGTVWPVDDARRVAVVVSANIKPYLEAVKGLRDALEEDPVQATVFLLDEEADLNALRKRLREGGFSFCVSVGPEATSFLDTALRDSGCPLVYTMVLSPDKLLDGDGKSPCGVSLSIPVFSQITRIRQALPAVRRIGILFNPDDNADFFRQAATQGRLLGVEIVPLEVTAQKDIPETLERHWDAIDALWFIPDQTVISKALVEYAIKEALLQKKAVVGYNRFFYESGAAVAFALDYEKVGRKTGELVRQRFRGVPCREILPPFDVLVNPRVLESIGLERTEK